MKFLLILILLVGLAQPTFAAEIEPPQVTGEAANLLPGEMPSFGEGLWYVVKSAVKVLRPDLAEAFAVCLSVVAIGMMSSIVSGISGKAASVAELAGVLGISVLLLGNANILIRGAIDTVEELGNYGRLLLPVMTAALAAQGGTSSSAALYLGTAFFDSLLGTAITAFLVPMVYGYLLLMITGCALGEGYLDSFRDFLKWLMSWFLKAVLFIFTGYISISGVITGGADKTALKAAKLTISGVVPVIGGMMSDASETILVGAGVVKNAVGIYGMLAVIAIVIVPFLKIGIMYFLLRCAAALGGSLWGKKTADLIQGFSEAMGILLAMTGTVCLLFLISIVSFLKGMNG